MKKPMLKHLKYLRTNLISYEDLESLSNDQCIKVRINYLYCLHVMNYQLELKDQKFWDIILKYQEIDKMVSYLKRPFSYNSSFYLMSVKDLKYLIKHSKYFPDTSGAFLKSNDKVDALENRIIRLKKEYTKKKNEDLRQDIEANFDERNIASIKESTNCLDNNMYCDVKVKKKSREICVKTLLK